MTVAGPCRIKRGAAAVGRRRRGRPAAAGATALAHAATRVQRGSCGPQPDATAMQRGRNKDATRMQQGCNKAATRTQQGRNKDATRTQLGCNKAATSKGAAVKLEGGWVQDSGMRRGAARRGAAVARGAALWGGGGTDGEGVLLDGGGLVVGGATDVVHDGPRQVEVVLERLDALHRRPALALQLLVARVDLRAPAAPARSATARSVRTEEWGGGEAEGGE